MLKRIFLLIFILFPSIGITQNNLTVVASIPPLNALASGVLEGVATPTLLVPPEASHHHYALKPSNMQALSQADVVIWIGDSLETFLEKPLSQLPKTTTLIEVQTLPTLTLYSVRHDQSWEHDDTHEHSSIDPHLWLDPHNAIVIINTLSKIFSEKDPAHAKQYQANAADMIKKIEKVDASLKKELTPIKDKKFLVFHDGYQYFEKYYGLNAVGSVAVNTDLPPSAQHLHELQQKIIKENIRCVFTEPGVSPAIVNTLVRDTSIRVGRLDNMGKGNHFNDYLNLMQSDGHSVAACLSAPLATK